MTDSQQSVWVVQDWKEWEGNIDSVWTTEKLAKERAAKLEHPTFDEYVLDAEPKAA